MNVCKRSRGVPDYFLSESARNPTIGRPRSHTWTTNHKPWPGLNWGLLVSIIMYQKYIHTYLRNRDRTYIYRYRMQNSGFGDFNPMLSLLGEFPRKKTCADWWSWTLKQPTNQDFNRVPTFHGLTFQIQAQLWRHGSSSRVGSAHLKAHNGPHARGST